MPHVRPVRPNGYDPEKLFRPRSVAIIGEGRLGPMVLANLAQSGFAAVQVVHDLAALEKADLAVIATEGLPVGPLLPELAKAGIFAAVAVGMAPDIAEASAATGVRVLGPGSFGIACPALTLNATLSHVPPLPGRVALVSQSAALCRAVLDWAEPNGVGFSQIIGIGGNAGVGFAQALDFLSRDTATGPILLDIRRIRDRRAFLSAARAAARLRPVVALRAGGRLLDPSGRAEAVFDAALKRAGLLTVTRLEDLLAAMETLTKSPPARGERLAIVTNATGPGHMAADAALSAGIELADLAPETQQVLQLIIPSGQQAGLVYVGVPEPTRMAEAAALLAGAREVGGVIAVFAPTGPGDAAGIAALAARPKNSRVPLLVCVMGETTGAVHRRTLANAGVPAFASPEQAVQGFRHLLQDRRARAAARELPDRAVLSIAPDGAGVAAIFAAVRAEGRLALASAEASAALACYGIHGSPGRRISVMDDPLFGPAIGLGQGRLADQAFGLPPLNLTLAHSLVQHARPVRGATAEQQEAAADILVRVSQLIIDFPEIAKLQFGAFGEPGTAELTLREAGRFGQVAIAPYPGFLTEAWEAGGETVTIRPIRPEDAAAHAALFTRLSSEDIRYRFFSALREISPERIARMTQIDYDREMAFVAIRPNGDTAGVSRLVREPDGAGEFAIIVDPALRGTGLARRLMERIIDWGAREGLTRIEGQVLADNMPMQAFIRRLGFTLHRLPEERDVLDARLDLTPPLRLALCPIAYTVQPATEWFHAPLVRPVLHPRLRRQCCRHHGRHGADRAAA